MTQSYREGLTIRPFIPADQTAVRQLIITGLGEHFGYIDESRNPDLDDISASYLAPGHTFIVAEIEGDMAGTGALVTESERVGRLVRMSVSRRHRRQGIGRVMVAYLLRVARQRAMKRVLVETNLNWFDAIGLYQSCGFREYTRDEESVYLSLALE